MRSNALQRTRWAFVFALFVIGGLAACSDNGTMQPNVKPSYLVRPHNCGGLPNCNYQPQLTDTTPVFENLKICKFGSSADIKVSEIQPAPRGASTGTFPVAAGQCWLVGDHNAGEPTTYNVGEIAAQAGFQLDHVEIVTASMIDTTTASQNAAIGDSITITKPVGRYGYVVKFYNVGLTLNKSAGAAVVNAGGQISFTMQLTVNGAGTARNVVLNDTLPSGAGVSWAINAPVAGCSIVSGVLSCAFGNLVAGDSRSVTVTSNTTFASCGAYPNTARASADDVAPVVSSASTTVRCSSLSITKSSDAATVNAGSNIGFTIGLSSNGPGTATGVVMTDTLPTGTGISWSMSPSVQGCSIVNSLLSCSFGDLASGQTRTVHITSSTTTGSCNLYSNTASASATNHAAVKASASTTVVCPPPVGNFNGCTPGFWKQNQHFAYWTAPYTQGTLLKNVFSGTVGYFTNKGNKAMGNLTMLDGLNFQGGSSIGGAAEILIRAATSAVLNAANPNVNYPRTISEIVTSVNAALASGNRATILGLAEGLDKDNNLGECTAKTK